MPILSVSGELIPRKGLRPKKQKAKKTRRNLSGISPVKIVKPTTLKKRLKKKASVSENTAKYIFEMQDAQRLRQALGDD